MPRPNGSAQKSRHKRRETAEPRTVLLCDDDRHTRIGLARVLIAEGFRILATESVAESLPFLERGDLLAVVADLRLPGGPDGTELLAAARRRVPHVQRFLLTADIAGAELAALYWSTLIDKSERASTGKLIDALRGTG